MNQKNSLPSLTARLLDSVSLRELENIMKSSDFFPIYLIFFPMITNLQIVYELDNWKSVINYDQKV